MPSTMYNDAIFVTCMFINITVMLQVISLLISCFFLSSYNIVSDGSGQHYPLDRYFSFAVRLNEHTILQHTF